MSSEAVSPLRLNKTPTASPTKGSSMSRPLSEIGATERRRNSPSFNQTSRKLLLTKESSPYESSPFTNSPRLFWKEQTISPKARFGSENEGEGDESLLSVSPKRNSIENLKKASRVKNSSMYAREQKNEYDPTSVQPPNRPLASGRPLSTQVQGNAFGGSGLAGLRKQNETSRGHHRGESLSKIPLLSPSRDSLSKQSTPTAAASPSKQHSSPVGGRMSPNKSSLVSPSRYESTDYNPDSSIWSDDSEIKHPTARPLRRYAKSVTFDNAPPTINEYEMVTPDPSSVTSGSREGSYETDEEELSFDQDDSFDASLEDTDKTPVVLPEDWRHMSPEAANTSLANVQDDVFLSRDVSPMPQARPESTAKMGHSRHGSATSDGDSRPLPPLPGPQKTVDLSRRNSSAGLSAAAERASERRSLPQLPPTAGISKADFLSMREGSMSLEDRLQLMNSDEERDASTPTQERQDQQLEKSQEVRVQVTEIEEVSTVEIIAETPKVPRISRESILRKVKSRGFDDRPTYDYIFEGESIQDASYGDLADLDPDVPIPSREVSSNFDDEPAYGETDSVIDAYSFAETTEVINELDLVRDTSVIRYNVEQQIADDDDASHYSSQPDEQPTVHSHIEASGASTPTAVNSSPSAVERENKRNELFASFSNNEIDLRLDPLKASFTKVMSPLDTAPKIDEMRQFLRRPETPEADADAGSEEPSTPDSVIRHTVAISPPDSGSPSSVPEVEATVKGAGGKLRTRPSLLPADIDMAATRRHVSGERPPPVPERSPKRQSVSLDFSQIEEDDGSAPSTNKENMMLDLNIGTESHDLSFGLDKEFDNIIEAQKKGYLMRQNTKVVVASSRQFSDEKPPLSDLDGNEKTAKPANDSPRKTSAERRPAWTTEPWNGKARRRSIRTTSGTRRVTAAGPAPPLPGQESAVASGLESVAEQGLDQDFEEGEERGRLFVKVVGVKDLDLPLPKAERTNFQLTLDNGLHCVTTAWLELGRTAPVGQEFELVVLDDLEFQLTLQTKLEPPALSPLATAPARPVNAKKSHSAFRNLLSSPKKRKEQERKLQEEADRQFAQQQQQEAEAKRNTQPTAWDLLHDLVGPDGSFARAYVCLKNHEDEAFGRPLTVDIPCFNEWAVDDSGVSSVKSKRGGIVRRPPYRVGKLTLQLLYVPKPKTAKDEDMPKSMNACIRELKEAEEVKAQTWEGNLSQQGGDCPYWRRRFFRLDGTTLSAYHEHTRQLRARIDLAKATKLIDDKSALTQPSKTKSGGRRKSAFAEEEEGYMFVEEGFRMRFANGEVIDFYADSADEKAGWMKVLVDAVGKDAEKGRGWTNMVLQKEQKAKLRAQAVPQLAQAKALLQRNSEFNGQQARPRASGAPTSQSTPTSPVKHSHARTRSALPGMSPHAAPLEKDNRYRAAPAAARERQSPVKPSRRDQVHDAVQKPFSRRLRLIFRAWTMALGRTKKGALS